MVLTLFFKVEHWHANKKSTVSHNHHVNILNLATCFRRFRISQTLHNLGRARLNCVNLCFGICLKSLCPKVVQTVAKNAHFFTLDLSVLPIPLLFFFFCLWKWSGSFCGSALRPGCEQLISKGLLHWMFLLPYSFPSSWTGVVWTLFYCVLNWMFVHLVLL